MPPDPAPDAATARAGTVLEPVVAAIEGALMALRACEAIAPDARQEAEAALTAAHGRLIQQWFGDNRGQDSLFDDPALG